MKKKFYQFLRDNNCLVEFLVNQATGRRKRGKDEYTMRNIINRSPDDLIDCAFLWNDTSEGYGYWSNLSDKWRNLINTK